MACGQRFRTTLQVGDLLELLFHALETNQPWGFIEAPILKREMIATCKALPGVFRCGDKLGKLLLLRWVW